MKTQTKGLLAAAGIVSLAGAGVAGTNIASAMTDKTSDRESSLVDAIASKFNLNKTEVQKVFDEQRDARHAEMQQKRLDYLRKALNDKKITQSQYDHIVKAWDDIDKLMKESGDPRDMTSDQRQAIKDKMDELKKWLKDQNINLKSLGVWGMGQWEDERERHHGHGESHR